MKKGWSFVRAPIGECCVLCGGKCGRHAGIQEAGARDEGFSVFRSCLPFDPLRPSFVLFDPAHPFRHFAPFRALTLAVVRGFGTSRHTPVAEPHGGGDAHPLAGPMAPVAQSSAPSRVASPRPKAAKWLQEGPTDWRICHTARRGDASGTCLSERRARACRRRRGPAESKSGWRRAKKGETTTI